MFSECVLLQVVVVPAIGGVTFKADWQQRRAVEECKLNCNVRLGTDRFTGGHSLKDCSAIHGARINGCAGSAIRRSVPCSFQMPTSFFTSALSSPPSIPPAGSPELALS